MKSRQDYGEGVTEASSCCWWCSRWRWWHGGGSDLGSALRFILTCCCRWGISGSSTFLFLLLLLLCILFYYYSPNRLSPQQPEGAGAAWLQTEVLTMANSRTLHAYKHVNEKVILKKNSGVIYVGIQYLVVFSGVTFTPVLGIQKNIISCVVRA